MWEVDSGKVCGCHGNRCHLCVTFLSLEPIYRTGSLVPTGGTARKQLWWTIFFFCFRTGFRIKEPDWHQNWKAKFLPWEECAGAKTTCVQVTRIPRYKLQIAALGKSLTPKCHQISHTQVPCSLLCSPQKLLVNSTAHVTLWSEASEGNQLALWSIKGPLEGNLLSDQQTLLFPLCMSSIIWVTSLRHRKPNISHSLTDNVPCRQGQRWVDCNCSPMLPGQQQNNWEYQQPLQHPQSYQERVPMADWLVVHQSQRDGDTAGTQMLLGQLQSVFHQMLLWLHGQQGTADSVTPQESSPVKTHKLQEFRKQHEGLKWSPGVSTKIQGSHEWF